MVPKVFAEGAVTIVINENGKRLYYGSDEINIKGCDLYLLDNNNVDIHIPAKLYDEVFYGIPSTLNIRTHIKYL